MASNAALRVLLVTVVASCLCVLSARSWHRIDVSEGRVNSLSDGAESIMRGLDGPVRVEVFLSRDLPAQFARHTQRIRDTLAEFEAAAKHPFEVVYTDPTDDDEAARRARGLGVGPRETSARSRGKLEAQSTWMGLSLHHGGRELTLPWIESVALFEYELARMLRELQGAPTKATLAVITGHGEPDLVAALADERHPLRPVAQALAEDYALDAVDLASSSTLPGEASVALLFGPQAPLRPEARSALADFVGRGGALAVFPLAAVPDPRTRQVQPAPVDLAELLGPWGVELGTKLIVQRSLNGTLRLPVSIRTAQGPRTVQQPVSSPLVPILRDLDRDHPVSRRLQTAVAPFAVAVRSRDVPGVDVTVLARSEDTSTVGARVESLDPRALKERQASERPGAQPVLVALQGSLPAPDGASPPGTRVVVAGSFEMPLATPGLLLATVDWLAADEQLLGIRPRRSVPALLSLPEGRSADALPFLGTLGVPVLLLLSGFARLRRRR